MGFPPSPPQLFSFLLKTHYAPVSQANWCNMTFTAGSLFPSHSCIGWTEWSPHRDSNLVPQLERWTTYQLSYPTPPQLIKFSKLIETFDMVPKQLLIFTVLVNLSEIYVLFSSINVHFRMFRFKSHIWIRMTSLFKGWQLFFFCR